jgi:hypothetical protein
MELKRYVPLLSNTIPILLLTFDMCLEKVDDGDSEDAHSDEECPKQMLKFQLPAHHDKFPKSVKIQDLK